MLSASLSPFPPTPWRARSVLILSPFLVRCAWSDGTFRGSCFLPSHFAPDDGLGFGPNFELPLGHKLLEGARNDKQVENQHCGPGNANNWGEGRSAIPPGSIFSLQFRLCALPIEKTSQSQAAKPQFEAKCGEKEIPSVPSQRAATARPAPTRFESTHFSPGLAQELLDRSVRHHLWVVVVLVACEINI